MGPVDLQVAHDTLRNYSVKHRVGRYTVAITHIHTRPEERRRMVAVDLTATPIESGDRAFSFSIRIRRETLYDREDLIRTIEVSVSDTLHARLQSP